VAAASVATARRSANERRASCTAAVIPNSFRVMAALPDSSLVMGPPELLLQPTMQLQRKLHGDIVRPLGGDLAENIPHCDAAFDQQHTERLRYPLNDHCTCICRQIRFGGAHCDRYSWRLRGNLRDPARQRQICHPRAPEHKVAPGFIDRLNNRICVIQRQASLHQRLNIKAPTSTPRHVSNK
jgi:hypothetical protein